MTENVFRHLFMSIGKGFNPHLVVKRSPVGNAQGNFGNEFYHQD
ncbi:MULTISPECIES: hypothetical protein [Cylindrospermopsis]|nr:hypothetical protein [Cylindrospermopsis sp. CR12]